MAKPSKLFDRYQHHYVRGSEDYFVDPAIAAATGRDRVPPWLRSLPRDARILDAGCADGYMLAALRHAGFQNIVGVDISPEMSALARKRLGPDIPIATCSLDRFLASSPQTYDVILLHHVIEHISRDSTLGLLQSLHSSLSAEGLLSIKTPNANSLVATFHANGDFTHVIAFNEQSIRQVLEFAGFEPDDISVIVQPPNLFLSFRYWHRTVFRALNRVRWHANRLFHRVVYLLADARPQPRAFELELEVLARK